MVFYKKKGFPHRGEIVLCKVMRILPHSVFAQLIEYKSKEGMIHVSELSNRWTKNIASVVSIGQQIVCRVEKVNLEKGFIDLSKKRVTGGEEKNKKNEIRNENRIEKTIEYACKQSKITLEEFYKKAGFNIIKEYGLLYNFFENYIEDISVVSELTLPDNFKKELKQSFDSLIKNSRANSNKTVEFIANGENGIENIKTFVKELLNKTKEKNNSFEIKYIDASKYMMSIESKNYKELNIYFEKIVASMKKLAKNYDIKLL